MSCGHVFKQKAKESERGSEMEGEEKDNPQGLWLSLFPPQVLLLHTRSIPLPRTLSPISPILSGDFQRGNGGSKGFQFLWFVSHMSREEEKTSFFCFPNISELLVNSKRWEDIQKDTASKCTSDLQQYLMRLGLNALEQLYVAYSEVMLCDSKPLNSHPLTTFQRGSIWSTQVHRDSQEPHASVTNGFHRLTSHLHSKAVREIPTDTEI